MKIICLKKLMTYNINKILVPFLFIGVVFLLTSGCSGDDMDINQHSNEQIKTISQIPKEKWDSLSRKKIFFGHQSVGNNIIDGIRDLMKENQQIKLNIVKTSSLSDFNKPLFAHDNNLGKNNDPKSKIDSFVDFMEKGLGNKTDIAFMKFCFVDIDSRTNINSLFNDYNRAMSEIRKKYPRTILVHFTVPLLRKSETTFKSFIKGLIGKKDNFFDNDHNVARNEFNELIKNEYGGKELVFDLAMFESTYTDGRRETFTKNGKKYYSLVLDYTTDGGHLNETGRKKIAEQLLIFLANL